MTGGKTIGDLACVVFEETLWRYVSGLKSQAQPPLDRPGNSMRPIPIHSENPPCRGSERTTWVWSASRTEVLQREKTSH